MSTKICKLWVGTLSVCASLTAVYAGETIDPAKLEFFEKRIRPQLVKNCYSCHSAEKKIKGRLRVDGHAAIKAGGDSGPGVVPGNPDKSLIIEAMVYANPDLQMPPENKLPEDVVQDFITWVKDGAVWPAESEKKSIAEEPRLDFEKLRKEHWAFKAIQNPPPPPVSQPTWVKDSLDAFVLARLDEKKISAGPVATKHSLLRRVSIDLTGLPPTPEEISAFLNDTSPDAFERVVDRLLASPHFGERWGRHWLDVARYAESAGGGRIVALSNAWRYREYVIASFNKDKPYTQFLTEQIAGDLMPTADMRQHAEQVIATGFLAVGPKNLDTQDKELLRMDVVDEQVDTLGKAVLGMTIGCARCHDHKFDPITAKEYYAMAAIFRSTKTLTPGNVSGVVQTGLPQDAATQAKLNEHEKQVAQLEARLHAMRTQAKAQAATLKNTPAPGTAVPTVIQTAPMPPPVVRGALDPAKLPGIVVDDAQANIGGTWLKSTYTKNYVGDGYIHDNRKQKGEMSVTYSPSIPKTGLYEVRFSYSWTNGRDTRVPVIIQHADGEKTVFVDQSLEPSVDGYFVSLGKFPFNQGNDGSVTVSNMGTTGIVTSDAVQFLPVEEAATTQKPDAVAGSPAPAKPADPLASVSPEDEKKVMDALEKEIRELKKKAPPSPQALAVRDEEQVGEYNVCIRGDVHRLGEPVQRGFMKLAAFESPAVQPKQSGRLELAAWLNDPRNPLTPRVIANRIWHHLFGAGLVRSTDNFGTTGEQPSHPELLDHLAMRFTANNGSFKKTIRAIVLSNTYQLASTHRADAARVDPENRLLWRANRRRVDAETLRDSILLNSGQLTLTPPPADLLRMEQGYGKELRRTVYLPLEREKMDDMLEVFDFPDTNLVVGTRNRSNIPTQSLFLMNSPFVMEHARKAAEKLLAEPGLADDGARIERAYLAVLGRAPDAQERALSLTFVSSGDPKTKWPLFYQALFGCLDFRFVD